MHHLQCRGDRTCHVNISNVPSLVPDDSRLVSARLDMDVVCTDFDSSTEKIEQITIGSKVIRGELGTWPQCHGNCSETVRVLSRHDVSALVERGALTTGLTVSPAVDHSPCDGDLVIARIALTVTAAEGLQADQLTGPLMYSFTGSKSNLSDLSINTPGNGRMLLFESQTGLKNGSLYWINVES